MFLSYAVVPVFVFTILLNFIYVYSAEETDAAPPTPAAESKNFTKCNDCVKSKCHTESKGLCVPNNDTGSTFQCLECKTDPAGNPQFFTEELCNKGCTETETKTCICEGSCYSCVIKADYPDPDPTDCKIPTQMADETCNLVDFEPPSVDGVPSAAPSSAPPADPSSAPPVDPSSAPPADPSSAPPANLDK